MTIGVYIPAAALIALSIMALFYRTVGRADARRWAWAAVLVGALALTLGPLLATPAMGMWSIATLTAIVAVMATTLERRSIEESALLLERARVLDAEIRRYHEAAHTSMDSSRHWFHEVAQHAPIGIFEADLDGACVWLSKKCAEMLGRDRKNFLGKSWLEWLHPDDRERARTAPLNAEFEVKDTSGQAIWAIQKSPYNDEHGRTTGIVATLSDVTERRRRETERADFERRLAEMQKMESLGLMAGGVAHDFNNLLVAVRGGIDLIEDALRTNDNPRPILDVVRSAADQGADLARHMLAFAGRGSAEIAAVAPAAIVEDLAPLLVSSVVKSRRLTLDLNNRGVAVAADPTQIRQLVFNLVGNAAEAVDPQTGTIIVKVDEIEADQAELDRGVIADGLKPGRYARIIVEDDGPGIPDSERRRVFEPFVSTKFTGRGLGLPVCLGIVRGHKGTIRLEPVSPHGTRAVVLLPVSTAAPARPKLAPSIASPERRTGTILIVDDEPLVRKTTRQMLERRGYVIAECGDGREAVSILRSLGEPPICALIDMVMPGIDGNETLRRIRSELPHLPAIFTSGYSSGDVVQDAALADAFFLQKPFTQDALLKKIDAASQRRPSTSVDAADAGDIVVG